jgi:hypothetical protein
MTNGACQFVRSEPEMPDFTEENDGGLDVAFVVFCRPPYWYSPYMMSESV